MGANSLRRVRSTRDESDEGSGPYIAFAHVLVSQTYFWSQLGILLCECYARLRTLNNPKKLESRIRICLVSLSIFRSVYGKNRGNTFRLHLVKDFGTQFPHVFCLMFMKFAFQSWVWRVFSSRPSSVQQNTKLAAHLSSTVSFLNWKKLFFLLKIVVRDHIHTCKWLN